MLPTILRCSAGATLPMFSLIFGQLINAVGQNLNNLPHLVTEVDKVWASALLEPPAWCSPHGAPAASWPASPSEGLACRAVQVCLYFVYLSIVGLVAGYFEVAPWMWSGAPTAHMTSVAMAFVWGTQGCDQSWRLEALSRGKYSRQLHRE